MYSCICKQHPETVLFHYGIFTVIAKLSILHFLLAPVCVHYSVSHGLCDASAGRGCNVGCVMYMWDLHMKLHDIAATLVTASC